MQNEKREKWTKEKIISEIISQSVDGVCIAKDMSLTTMARRRFGSWQLACSSAGVLNLRNSKPRYSICQIDGCQNVVRHETCKWCEKHYYRNRRNGDPEKLFLKQYSINEEFFDVWSPEVAWIVGVLWSDGWLNGHTVGFKSKDEQFVDEVKRVLHTNVETKIEKSKYFRISIASAKIESRLREIGMCEGKSLIIGWPVGMPAELNWHFLRGIMDGDGCVHLRKKRKGQQATDCRWSFVSGSSIFAKEALSYLCNYGIKAQIVTTQPSLKVKNPLYRINVYEQKSLRKIIEQMYPFTDVPCLHRKRDLLMEFYTTKRVKSGRPKTQDHKETRNCIVCNGSFICPITSKKICCGRKCGHELSWRTRRHV